jgi:hypothetical protein
VGKEHWLPVGNTPQPVRRIKHPGKIVERLVTTKAQCPLSHDMAYFLGRLVAHRRAEVDKEFTPTVPRPPGSKGISKKIECLIGITSFPVVILTLDNLRLLGMKRQFAQGGYSAIPEGDIREVADCKSPGYCIPCLADRPVVTCRWNEGGQKLNEEYHSG